jgi:hypothetical protein
VRLNFNKDTTLHPNKEATSPTAAPTPAATAGGTEGESQLGLNELLLYTGKGDPEDLLLE